MDGRRTKGPEGVAWRADAAARVAPSAPDCALSIISLLRPHGNTRTHTHTVPHFAALSSSKMAWRGVLRSSERAMCPASVALHAPRHGHVDARRPFPLPGIRSLFQESGFPFRRRFILVPVSRPSAAARLPLGSAWTVGNAATRMSDRPACPPGAPRAALPLRLSVCLSVRPEGARCRLIRATL